MEESDRYVLGFSGMISQDGDETINTSNHVPPEKSLENDDQMKETFAKRKVSQFSMYGKNSSSPKINKEELESNNEEVSQSNGDNISKQSMKGEIKSQSELSDQNVEQLK